MCRAPGSSLSAPPASYTAAVERYSTGAGTAESPPGGSVSREWVRSGGKADRTALLDQGFHRLHIGPGV